MINQKADLFVLLDAVANRANEVKISFSSAPEPTAHHSNAIVVANYAIECTTWLKRTSQHIEPGTFDGISKMLIVARDSLDTARGALSSGQGEIGFSRLRDAAAACHASTTTFYARPPGDPQVDPPPPLPSSLGNLAMNFKFSGLG
jgi:hypothetical protein